MGVANLPEGHSLGHKQLGRLVQELWVLVGETHKDSQIEQKPASASCSSVSGVGASSRRARPA
eukprot:NODE_26400_length_217_cov_1.315476_g25230_i0.p1 GENE.NODE_26400_length_217_cov_1.315476_g25230_i0~~NODE_26400_length_217_cov_1.315476_g25230_i0.p1  ORF type:complete len:71 (+),score=1.70 NODE_26400_length_217_cov_1.315476_g25230_i0:26-214(+)